MQQDQQNNAMLCKMRKNAKNRIICKPRKITARSIFFARGVDMNRYYIFFALLAGALCFCMLPEGEGKSPGIEQQAVSMQADTSAGAGELVTVGKIDIVQPIVVGADIINFVDTKGKTVVSICMRTGTIAHSFSGMSEAGKQAADIFWGSFGEQLRARIATDQQ